MSGGKDNLFFGIAASTGSTPPNLPKLNSTVCVRNREAYRSLALETCHVGRVVKNFNINNKWYCSVSLYLRPEKIPAETDNQGYILDNQLEVVKDHCASVGTFDVEDVFCKCKIISADLSRSVESIIQEYSDCKPCFVLRFHLVKAKTGGFVIEPLPVKKMARDKSEVLSENGLNTKAKEGTLEMNGMKSPRHITQSKALVEKNHSGSHPKAKENIAVICSSNAVQMKQELSENEDTGSPLSKHGKLSRTTVRRSLASDLEFSPMKQSRLDDGVKSESNCVVENENIEMDGYLNSTCKDSWVSELLDNNDPIVENGRCLTPIRLSLKRIRLDTTPSKEHSKNNISVLSEKKETPRSAQKKERTAFYAESSLESDSDVHSIGSSIKTLSMKPPRRSERMSKCKHSLAEAANDSDTEEVSNGVKCSARKHSVQEENLHTPRKKLASSDETNLDRNRSTRCSVRNKEPTTTPTSRSKRFQLQSPPSKHCPREEIDVSYPEECRAAPSRRGRPSKLKGQSQEDTDDLMMSPDESEVPLSHRTLNKTPKASDKTPKKTPKSATKPPSRSPRTPKTRKAVRTPSRSALTPSMPARATAPLTPISSLEQVRKNLHVSAVPMSLPCRESEYRNIYNFLENKIRDAAGGCMYISGVPGTGKTATVHAVIRSLKEQVGLRKLRDFQYIETNGLRMTEPRQVFVQVLKGLTGQKCTPQQAQDILAERFCTGSSKNKTVVLLVDEVDMLRNRRQDVIYNLFDWPSKPNSHFIVLTIANTMDLPERLLKGRVTSRLGLTRLTFQPYSYKQLQEIVMSRLQGSKSFNDDAVELVARKVAACSGDVRRALDVCRRASEVVEEGSPVTMPIINKVISQMMNSANVCSIKACSRLEKLFLQAVVAENERTGVEETTFISVYRQFQSLCALSSVSLINISEAMAVVSRLGTSGLLLTEHARADINQSIFLNVNADDIHYALNQAVSAF